MIDNNNSYIYHTQKQKKRDDNGQRNYIIFAAIMAALALAAGAIFALAMFDVLAISNVIAYSTLSGGGALLAAGGVSLYAGQKGNQEEVKIVNKTQIIREPHYVQVASNRREIDASNVIDNNNGKKKKRSGGLVLGTSSEVVGLSHEDEWGTHGRVLRDINRGSARNRHIRPVMLDHDLKELPNYLERCDFFSTINSLQIRP